MYIVYDACITNLKKTKGYKYTFFSLIKLILRRALLMQEIKNETFTCFEKKDVFLINTKNIVTVPNVILDKQNKASAYNISELPNTDNIIKFLETPL